MNGDTVGVTGVVLLSIDNDDDGTSADETVVDGIDDNETDDTSDDVPGTADVMGAVGEAALVLTLVGPKGNGAAVLGVTEPLIVVKP